MSYTINRQSIGQFEFGTMEPIGSSRGTLGSGITTETRGDGVHNRTKITIPSTLAKSVTAATSACYNHKILTFPAGVIEVETTYQALNPPSGVATGATTCDIGLGTTAATGANIVLSVEGAGTENLMTGQTVTPSATAAVPVTSGGGGAVGSSVVIPATGGHAVYLNIAGLWDATGSLTFPGTIVIDWKKVT